MLDLGDIQRGALGPRPSPYAGAYLLLRIHDHVAGREALKRLTPLIASAADLTSPLGDAWLAVALSYQGLKALGVPQASLASFSPFDPASRPSSRGDASVSTCVFDMRCHFRWSMTVRMIQEIVATKVRKTMSPARPPSVSPTVLRAASLGSL